MRWRIKYELFPALNFKSEKLFYGSFSKNEMNEKNSQFYFASQNHLSLERKLFK